MSNTRSFPAMGVSLVVHVLMLIGMAMFQHNLQQDQPKIAVESIFSEERVQEEFHRELEVETEVAETMNTQTGGVVSTQVAAAAGPAASQVNIETSEVMQEHVVVNVGPITVPGEGMIAMDLGEGEVQGEAGAFVDGYGAALGQITQELIRMMRDQKVMVVWLFDKSESMKDDQAEIRDNFHKVYEELGIVTKKDQELRRRGDDVLLTSVWAFGEKFEAITSKPTADIDEIRSAIDKIAIDESGLENTCMAISAALEAHYRQAQSQKRKLVLVVVSDESGEPEDGAALLERTLANAKQAKAPIYFLGREAIFGYPKARIRWVDPKYNLPHWVWIDRGPESAFPECLQWDGLHRRHDSYSSGFGPYTQVRLAKETGGIFFVLPGEEENLTGPGARDQRRFDALDMKEYEPLLVSRREYMDEVNGSKFRTAIMKVIEMLDPQRDSELNIRNWHYPLGIVEFRQEAQQQVRKAGRAMAVLNEVIPIMEGLRPLRAKEESQRWRAHYDLILGQLYCYRVRLFQYLLAMDHHANTDPKPASPKSNEWNVHRVREMMTPDDAQFQRLKTAFKVKVGKEEYLQELKQQEEKSRELFAFVINEHPRTPWSKRADYELRLGFGMKFAEGFRDPNYARVGRDIHVPKF